MNDKYAPQITESHMLQGKYMNCFEIGYNAFEFIFDFCQRYEQEDEGRVHSRIVTNPYYAKIFFDALQQSLEKYEQLYGPIEER